MDETKLDFALVPTYNSKTIHIVDRSFYKEDPNNPGNPLPIVDPILEINVPDFNKVEIPFIPNGELFLDSTILELTSQDAQPLPDGVYHFKYTNFPEYYNKSEKTILRINKLQEKFDSAFMKLDFMQCDASLKKQQKITLDTIYYLMHGAVAAANNCATEQAVYLYKKASKMLYNFEYKGLCCGDNTISRFY